MPIFHLSFTPGAYYAGSIVTCLRFPVDHPVTDHPLTDRHLWIEVAEYLFAVAFSVALVWLIADELGSPLWGGLTSIRLR
jgi:hypothetical protein